MTQTGDFSAWISRTKSDTDELIPPGTAVIYNKNIVMLGKADKDGDDDTNCLFFAPGIWGGVGGVGGLQGIHRVTYKLQYITHKVQEHSSKKTQWSVQ